MRTLESRISAVVTAIAASIAFATAVSPATLHHDHGPTGRLSALADRLGCHLAGRGPSRDDLALFGTLLLILAGGLWGRRLLAHRTACGVVAVAAVTIGVGSHAGQPLVALGIVLAMLWLIRDAFPVRPDPHHLRVRGLLAAAATTTAGGWMLSDSGPAAHGLTKTPVDLGAASMLLSLAVAGAGVAALLWVFAPGQPPPPGSPNQREAVAALVTQPGADTLAPFCTRSDRTYAFSADGKAALGYRVLFGTAVVGGDPVGEPASVPDAIAAFLDRCSRQGWRPAVLGAGAGMVDQWRQAGLARGVVIGDEAVVTIDQFTMSSRRMRNLRQAVQRSHNAGVRVRVGQLDEAASQALRPVLDEWLRGRGERGFAMNLDRILVPRPDCLVAVAHDHTGQPQAFARFAVAAGGGVLTLDVAPRRRDAPNGVIERLIVEVIDYGREHGAREVSLNFAGLRQVLSASGTPARLASAALRGFDPWIQLASLNSFVGKFRPQWRPRWLLLRSWTELGWVFSAAVTAEFATSRRSTKRILSEDPNNPALRNGETGEFAGAFPLIPSTIDRDPRSGGKSNVPERTT